MERLLSLLEDFRRERSAAAMEEIVRATRPRLLAAARRIGSREDAEDSVQAAYHALLARPEAPAVAVLPWLLAAVVRIAYRKKALARRELGIADRLARPATPFEEASRAEVAALVRREVARLPARYRDPVVLFHLEGLSVTEVARLLDIPASTVTTQLQRARLLLRTRLSPALLHSAMFVPWLLWDSCKTLAVPVGGVMKAKTAVVVVGLAVATGAAGFGAGLAHRTEESPRSAARVEAPRAPGRDEEVEELRRRVAELQGMGGGTGEGAPAAAAPTEAVDLGTARGVAERLGVPAESLDIARRAYRSLANNADPATQKEALDALHALGEGRAVAVAAFLRIVEGGDPFAGVTSMRALLEAAHVPGDAHLFVDLLKDGDTSSWVKMRVLDNADAVDSDAIRGYLLERLGQEQDRYMWASIAMGLGRLKEPRAVAGLAEGLRKDGEWLPFEPYPLFALGQIGGYEAEAAIVSYLDSPDRIAISDAVWALAKIDATKARVRAEMLLDDPNRKLSPKTREDLAEIAGRAAR